MHHAAASRIETFVRILAATAILFACYGGLEKAFVDVAPMSWWVHYESISLVEGPDDRQLFRVESHSGWISRWFQPSVPVLRYVKITQQLADGSITRCSDALAVTADQRELPYVYFYVSELFPRSCSLAYFSGEVISVSMAWQISLPFNINKTKSFRLGPYRVDDGRLMPIGMVDG